MTPEPPGPLDPPLDAEVAARVSHLEGVTVERYFAEGLPDAPPVPDVPDLASVDIDDRTVRTPHGEVPVRRYRRRGSHGRRPAVVWCHGGGWGLGNLDMVESHVVAQRVADALDATVVTVGYGLAPDHPYPIPQDQIRAAFEATGDDPAVDPERVVLGGASAGGHLAACVAHALARDGRPPRAAFLAYPVTDPLRGPYPTARFAPCPELIWFDRPKITELFARHAGEMPPPPGSVPMDLPTDRMPPMLVTSVPLDGLGPQAAAYATKLRADGVDIEHHEVAGVLHGYLDMVGTVALADAALSRHLDWLGEQLAG